MKKKTNKQTKQQILLHNRKDNNSYDCSTLFAMPEIQQLNNELKQKRYLQYKKWRVKNKKKYNEYHRKYMETKRTFDLMKCMEEK